MPSSSTRRSNAFAFPYTKYDDTRALYANFRYLQNHLSTLGSAIKPAAYDLVVAASDSKDTERADVVCTGSNDQTTISDAIADYGTATSCSIFMMDGSFRFDGQLASGSRNLFIQGTGPATKINYYGADTYAFYLDGDGYDFTFNDFVMQDYVGGKIGIGAVGTAYQQDSLVHNVKFTNFGTGFFHARTVGRHLISSCIFDGCTMGIEGDREAWLMVNHSFFDTCTTGLYADSQRQQISNNYFDNCVTGYSAGGGSGSRGTALTGNVFDQISGTSVVLSGHGDNPTAITGNTFIAGGTGITMGNWFGNISPAAIVGNTFNNMTMAYDTSVKNAASVYKGNVFDGTTPVISEVDTVAALDDIGDVTITSVADGETLRWNGTAWINNTLAELGVATAAHTHAVDDLSDVTITTVADNEVLAYDTTAVGWINQTAAEAGLSAAVHTHVEANITDLTHYTDPLTTKGDLFVFDTDAQRLALGTNTQVLTVDTTTATGVKWAAAGSGVAALDDVGDVTITTIASGEILKWNGTAWINNTLAEAAISDTSHAHSYNIEDLSNVTITAIADDELLQWDTAGATWENRTIAEAGLSAVGHTHAAGGAGFQDILMLGGM